MLNAVLPSPPEKSVKKSMLLFAKADRSILGSAIGIHE